MWVLSKFRSAILNRLVMTVVVGLPLFLGSISLIGTAANSQSASSSTPGLGSSGIPGSGSDGSSSSAGLLSATKQMQEMNQSFNLQYLNSQQDRQSKNRQFNGLTTTLKKNKHDTSRNSINTVR